MMSVVFSVSDVASHTMWESCEANQQDLGSFQQEIREAYISIWQALDQAVAQIQDHLAPEGHTLIISDHGFGPSHGVLHINQWLQ